VTQFSDFNLLPPLARALTAEGYETPTPIQAQTIPLTLEGKDVLGIAQTGTGKTAAFALPILHKLGGSGTTRKPRSCRALILSPTRELASQISDSFRAYGKFMHLSVDVVFGGIPIVRQIKRLTTGADILVATPGRLLDLINQRALTLEDVEILVLDEADQMLDLGFIQPLRRIIPMLPKKRQTMFFSATMPKTIADLAGNFLNNPVKVAVTPVATTAERVYQSVIHVPQAVKQGLLEAMLADEKIARALVFTRTKHGANRVVKNLVRAGFSADAIHGNKSQAQREKALAAFKAGTCRLLVATDIAARGIDVDGVTHVINFELPNVADQYVHRIGRTARAGNSGDAIAFCAPDERAFLRDIEKITRQTIPVMPYPQGFDPKAVRPVFDDREEEDNRPARFGRGGALRSQPGKPYSRSSGDRPQGGRPQGDRPAGRSEGGRPFENRGGEGRGGPRRFEGDRPQGRSEGGRSFEGRAPREENRAPRSEHPFREERHPTAEARAPREARSAQEDRPFRQERPQGERPRNDRPQGDKPRFGDKPRGPRPDGGHHGAARHGDVRHEGGRHEGRPSAAPRGEAPGADSLRRRKRRFDGNVA
jgi:ATP-dependent RNA helicase RhlE